MHSKIFLAASITLLISLAANAQTARQPFDDIGKEVKVLSLTNGKYEEFFDDDSLQRIGTAWININTMKVVKLVLTEEEERILDNSGSSRFLSVDPLTRNYPQLTPYQFASNRPIDGVDLDGLEYVSFVHIVNEKGQVIATKQPTIYYKMDEQTLLAHGGTPAGKFNSAGYGAEGKGIKHHYINADGSPSNIEDVWDLPQKTTMGEINAHGLFSGPGCITYRGKGDYDFSWDPIDEADAIAKQHDFNYASVHAYDVVEDTRTLFADKIMVAETKEYLISVPFMLIAGKRVAGETVASAESQKLFIGILADYKEWKTNYMREHNLDPSNVDDNKKVDLSDKKIRRAYINSNKLLKPVRKFNAAVLNEAKKQTSD